MVISWRHQTPTIVENARKDPEPTRALVKHEAVEEVPPAHEDEGLVLEGAVEEGLVLEGAVEDG